MCRHQSGLAHSMMGEQLAAITFTLKGMGFPYPGWDFIVKPWRVGLGQGCGIGMLGFWSHQ